MRANESGISLPFVLIAVTMITMAGIAYMSRGAIEASIGISTRDAELAEMLAESALNKLAGRFISATNASADINGDGTVDRMQGWVDISAAPATLTLGYQFYISAATVPSVLQRVANGDSTGTSCALATQNITGCASLKTSDLFISNTVRPLLFYQNDTGLHASAAANFSAEPSHMKAAAWIEVVANPVDPQWVDVYVQSTSQYNFARSYTQKFLGSYTNTLGGIVSPISEAANHG